MAVKVNDQTITEEMIKSEMERLRPKYEQAFAQMEKDKRDTQLYDWSRENIIEQVLISQQAEKEFPDIEQQQIEQSYQALKQRNPAIENQNADEIKSQIKKQLQAEKLVEKVTSDTPEINEKQIEKHYEQNKQKFIIPEMIRARHIVLHPDKNTPQEEQIKKLEKIKEEIDNGKPFEQAANENSSCPDNGGDLGYFPRGKMVPEFEDVVFNMSTGQVSDVFTTGFGCHIAKVIDRKQSMPCQLEYVRDMIKQELTQEAKQKALNKYVDKLKAEAEIDKG